MSSTWRGEQRGEEVAVDEVAGVVDEEAAVGVAVPGDPEVGALVEHPIDHELAILRQQRVRLVVGELAVRDPVGLDQLEPEPLEQRADHRPGHPVAAVEHHLQGPNRAGSISASTWRWKSVVDVDRLDLAAAGRPRGSPPITSRLTSSMPASPESASAPSRTSFTPV